MSKRRPPPPPPNWWDTIERPGRKIITGVAILTAMGYALGFFKPIIDSRLPTASQDDVKAVEKSATEQAKGILKQVEQLDFRQQQSISRGANVAGQLRSLRMQQLRAELDRLKDAKDEASRTLLIRDQSELDALIQEQNASPMP